jgi:hypothetical protein
MNLLPLILCVVFVLTASLLFGCQAQTVTPATANPAAAATIGLASAGTPSPTPSASNKALPASATYAIALDVNPSIELTVENGLVTKVAAYNDDAKQLLLKVDVIGFASADAMKKLVEALAAEGYINNAEIKPYLLISVIGTQQPDTGLADSLKTITSDALDSLNINCNIKVANISSDVSSKAEALGISAGRYMIFDYISKKEGITIEQTIAKYGSLKVADLMRLYDDMDQVFNGDNTDDKGNADIGTPLTPDQQVIVDAAQSTYQAEIKSAEEAYVKAKNEAISSLKTQWEELKAKYKGNEDSAEFKQAKVALKQSFKTLRAQIHDTFKKAVESAQAEFRTAVASLGLTEEQLDKLLDYQVNDNDTDDGGKYMNDGENDNVNDGTTGQNDDAQATDNSGNNDDKSTDQNDEGQVSDNGENTDDKTADQNDEGQVSDNGGNTDDKTADQKDDGQDGDSTSTQGNDHNDKSGANGDH